LQSLGDTKGVIGNVGLAYLEWEEKSLGKLGEFITRKIPL